MRERAHRREVRALDARNHDTRDARPPRRCGDLVAVGVEFRCIEMAVRIDPHDAFYTGTDGSSCSTPSRRRMMRSQRAARSGSCVTITKLVSQRLRQFEHQVEHGVGGAAVEVAGRLVGEHAGRMRDQRPRDRDALPFAARQFARPMLRPMPDAHALQHVHRLAARIVLRHAANPERHRDVVERREFRQQMVELIHEAERAIAQLVALALLQFRERLAEQRHAAGARLVEPAEHVQQRALARPRRPDDRQLLAAMHLQLRVVQHLDVEAALHEGLRNPPMPAARRPCHSHHSYRSASAGRTFAPRQLG